MGYVFQNAYLFKGTIQDNLNLYDSLYLYGHYYRRY